MSTNWSWGAVAPLVLRLALAAVFIYHGWQLVMSDTAWGTAWMKGANAQPAAVQAAVAWGELLGGLAVLLGFLTRWAAAGLAIIMVGAIVTVHARNGFDITHGGFEYNLVLIAVCVALILLGPGPIGVGRYPAFRRLD
jgi:putative oxidoreductase